MEKTAHKYDLNFIFFKWCWSLLTPFDPIRLSRNVYNFWQKSVKFDAK
jgi:hypothetical protein